MQRQGKIPMTLSAVLLAVCMVGIIFYFDWRAENNIRRMSEACEQAGMEFEIKSISRGGGVEGRCTRVLSRDGENLREDMEQE